MDCTGRAAAAAAWPACYLVLQGTCSGKPCPAPPPAPGPPGSARRPTSAPGAERDPLFGSLEGGRRI